MRLIVLIQKRLVETELIVTSRHALIISLAIYHLLIILTGKLLIYYLETFGDAALPTWTFGIDTNLVNILIKS